jgi:medium-chain acyl-[acyl-carrier-protein] hydrolase
MQEKELSHAVALKYEDPFIRRAARPRAKLRLFCLPYAGGGASAFTEWPSLISSDVEIIAIQLPGREDRVTDDAFTEAGPLVRSLVQAVRPYLTMPVAVFGHSGGAAMAYELAITLRRRLRFDLAYLFISGHPAPDMACSRQVHSLPDDEFAQFISDLGGTNTELLEDYDARSVILPPIRADFAMWETHKFSVDSPLDTPITVFGGLGDPIVRPAELTQWRDRTTGNFRVCLFPGGHFFMKARNRMLIEEIERDLAGV